MMPSMNCVKAFIVHESMGEVEEEIVQDDEKYDAEDQIQPAVVIYVSIHPGNSAFCYVYYSDDNHGKDNHAQHRVQYFTNDHFVWRKFLLNFEVLPVGSFPDVKHEVEDAGNDKVAQR